MLIAFGLFSTSFWGKSCYLHGSGAAVLKSDPNTNATSMVSTTDSWKDKLDAYDLSFYEPPSTGNQQLDDTFTYVIKQSHTLREAVEAGFTKLDQVTVELNKNIPVLSSNMEAMRSSIHQELGAPGSGAPSMGTRVAKLEQNLSDMLTTLEQHAANTKAESEAKWSIMGMTIEQQGKDMASLSAQLMQAQQHIQQLSAMQAGSNTSYSSPGKTRSILDHKSIQDHASIGDNRATFVDWAHKLKNKIRAIYGKDKSWEHWMECAEYSMKDPSAIRTNGAQRNPYYDNSYDDISDMLIELLTDKLEAGTTPYLKVKRETDGLVAWANVYKYYREISGQGLLNKELAIMQPIKAKKRGSGATSGEVGGRLQGMCKNGHGHHERTNENHNSKNDRN